ncbi:hypothetical protein BDV09DRAFT_176872 [Aspergillus tetrazonus]
MSWSIEEVVSFITMLFTVPTFILAVWGILKCYRRVRNRRPASEFSNDRLPLPHQRLTTTSSLYICTHVAS